MTILPIIYITMKHYFKWDLDNLIYIWKSELDLPHTLALDEVSDEEYIKINKWYNISYSDWKLILEDTSGIELSEKKEECQTKILENYSRSDQANITWDSIVSWDDTEFVKMRTFINAMLDEFHVNWKDADFSWIFK